LVEQLGALRLLAGGRAATLLPAAGPREHPDDFVADLFGVGVEVEQDARRDALVLAHEAEQDVLGPDVVVAQRERLSQRELEDLLGARGERDLAGGDLLTGPDDADDLGADALHRDVERLEHARCEALLLAKESQQDVLGADVVVLEDPGLLLSEDDHLAGPFGKALEHGAVLLLSGSPVVRGLGSCSVSASSPRLNRSLAPTAREMAESSNGPPANFRLETRSICTTQPPSRRVNARYLRAFRYPSEGSANPRGSAP